MIVITGRAKLKPEHRDRALAAASQMSKESLAEPGCLDYRFWVSPDDPNSVLLFEQWADQDALDTHLHGPGLPAFGKEFGSALDGGFDLTRFEIASSGPLR
jgi:quinol monooxygenase YgiN